MSERIETKIKNLEKDIFPNKGSGGIDERILDYVTAMQELLNILKRRFGDRERQAWVKVFGIEANEVTPGECIEKARALSAEYGSLGEYIKFSKKNYAFDRLSAEKRETLKSIFRD